MDHRWKLYIHLAFQSSTLNAYQKKTAPRRRQIYGKIWLNQVAEKKENTVTYITRPFCVVLMELLVVRLSFIILTNIC